MPREEHVKGLGDSCDPSVFVSHITPKQQAAVARFVERKCSVNCRLNYIEVSIITEHLRKTAKFEDTGC